MRSFGVCALALGGALVLSACGDSTSSGPGAATADGGAHDDADSTPGCGVANVVKGLQSKQTITVGSEARTYELFVPDSYDAHKTFPLVFVFHGDGGSGAGIRSSFKLEAASEQGAIFVYPDGAAKTWRFDDAAGLAKDVAFIDQLAKQLGTSHCTDRKRVFAVGFSRGAYFANMLGCFSTSGLRAVVGHAGGGPFGVDGSGTTFPDGELACPQPPLAALQVVGQNDGLLSETKKARDHWRRVNTCKDATAPYAPSPCVAYDGCAAGRPEVYCEVPGLAHAIWDQGAQVTWSFIASL